VPFQKTIFRLIAAGPNCRSLDFTQESPSAGSRWVRNGRVEPFLHAHPTQSSSLVRWAGVTVQNYSVLACVIHRHEHLENFVHVVLRDSVKYEVLPRGKMLDFRASPGTTFILPLDQKSNRN
jgi:hypothetical protein